MPEEDGAGAEIEGNAVGTAQSKHEARWALERKAGDNDELQAFPELPAWAHRPLTLPNSNPKGPAPDETGSGDPSAAMAAIVHRHSDKPGSLASCSTGMWIIVPLDGSFPAYAVRHVEGTAQSNTAFRKMNSW